MENKNAQKQITIVDRMGHIVKSIPYGDRYSRTKKEALVIASETQKEYEFWETTTSFQKKIER